MGVDYRAVLGIGVLFDDTCEVKDFVEDHKILSEEEREYVDDNGITEYSHESGIEVVCLDCYRDGGYFVGYELNPRIPDMFADEVKAAISDW